MDGFALLQNGSGAVQNRFAVQQNDPAVPRGHSATVRNGFVGRQNDSVALQNDSAAVQNHPVARQSGLGAEQNDIVVPQNDPGAAQNGSVGRQNSPVVVQNHSVHPTASVVTPQNAGSLCRPRGELVGVRFSPRLPPDDGFGFLLLAVHFDAELQPIVRSRDDLRFGAHDFHQLQCCRRTFGFCVHRLLLRSHGKRGGLHHVLALSGGGGVSANDRLRSTNGWHGTAEAENEDGGGPEHVSFEVHGFVWCRVNTVTASKSFA